MLLSQQLAAEADAVAALVASKRDDWLWMKDDWLWMLSDGSDGLHSLQRRAMAHSAGWPHLAERLALMTERLALMTDRLALMTDRLVLMAR